MSIVDTNEHVGLLEKKIEELTAMADAETDLRKKQVIIDEIQHLAQTANEMASRLNSIAAASHHVDLSKIR